jgi:hypothetical protein
VVAAAVAAVVTLVHAEEDVVVEVLGIAHGRASLKS